MKKNLFNAGVKEDVIARLLKLSEESKGKWGCMTPAEMLHHCSDALNGTMASSSSQKPDTIRQKITALVFINFVPRFPKNIQAPAKIDVRKSNIVAGSLSAEQQQLAETVDQLCNFSGPFSIRHPYFGKLNRRQWGIVSWMHLDHHFRQFGV